MKQASGRRSGIGHDLGNRLFRIASSASGAPATYAYDAQDRRVRAAVSGAATTRFLWSGAEEVADLDDGGALLRFIVPGPGVDDRVAMVAANDNTPKGVAYFHADRLGSVVATTDGAGLAAATYAYSPYGESDAPLSGNPFRFTGRRLDFESGLYHYRARYYAPRLGQFLQTDPIGAQDDPNLYLYVGLDPLNAVDPTGRETLYERSLMRRDMPPMSPRAVEAARAALGFVLDALPGVGELKGGIEFVQRPSIGGGIGLIAGLAPGGDLARPAIREGIDAALSNSDLVVRGGSAGRNGGNSVEGIARGTGTHPSGTTGFSAEASPGASLCDLCANVPNNQVGVTTVGDIRAAGGDVVVTSGRSPNRVTVTGIGPEEGNRLLTPTQTNPVPPDERRFR